jgi:hypothetical protein
LLVLVLAAAIKAAASPWEAAWWSVVWHANIVSEYTRIR